jgi:hypothetical protein
LGSGFTFSQLTNVILSDIPGTKAGVASGTNSTVRQVGNALGIAVIGTVVTTQTVDHAVPKIKAAATLTASSRQAALDGIHVLGANYQPPASPPSAARVLNGIMDHAVAGATHDALLYALGVVIVGLCMSFLVPSKPAPAASIAEDLASLVPIDPEGELEAPPPIH